MVSLRGYYDEPFVLIDKNETDVLCAEDYTKIVGFFKFYISGDFDPYGRNIFCKSLQRLYPGLDFIIDSETATLSAKHILYFCSQYHLRDDNKLLLFRCYAVDEILMEVECNIIENGHFQPTELLH